MSLWDKLTGNDQRKRAEEERQRLEVARQMSLRRAQQSSNPRVAQQATQKLQNNGWQVKQTQQPSLRQHIENATGTVGLGLGRSAIGTAQGLSGMYDLMTPGKGTNRFSQSLDTRAKRFDEIQRQQNRSQAGYKAGQFFGDALTFMGGGSVVSGATKGATMGVKAIPGASKVINPAIKGVTKLTKPVGAVTKHVPIGIQKGSAALAQKGAGGRIAATALRNGTTKSQLLNTGVDMAIGLGQPASKGQDIGWKDVALQGGMSTAFGVGLPATAQGVKEVFRMPSRLKTMPVRAEALNGQDIVDLRNWRNAMGTGKTMGEQGKSIYNNGIRASQKAGIDYRDGDAIDKVIGVNRRYNDQVGRQIDTAKTVNNWLNENVPVGLGIKNVDGTGKAMSVEPKDFVNKNKEQASSAIKLADDNINRLKAYVEENKISLDKAKQTGKPKDEWIAKRIASDQRAIKWWEKVRANAVKEAEYYATTVKTVETAPKIKFPNKPISPAEIEAKAKSNIALSDEMYAATKSRTTKNWNLDKAKNDQYTKEFQNYVRENADNIAKGGKEWDIASELYLNATEANAVANGFDRWIDSTPEGRFFSEAIEQNPMYSLKNMQDDLAKNPIAGQTDIFSAPKPTLQDALEGKNTKVATKPKVAPKKTTVRKTVPQISEEMALTKTANQPPTKPPKPPTGSAEQPALGTGKMKSTRYASETVPKSDYVSKPIKETTKKNAPLYTPENEKLRYNQALTKYEKLGRDKFENDLYEQLNGKKGTISSSTVAEGQALAAKLDSEGNYAKASEIYDKISEHLTASGQTIQAAAIMSRRSPEGLRKHAVQVWKKAGVKVTQEAEKELVTLTQAVKKAQTPEAKAKAIYKVNEHVKKQVPDNIWNKTVNIWRAGLLTSPMTTAGNLFANTGETAIRKGFVNPVSTAADAAMGLFTGKRTMSLADAGSASKGFKEGASSLPEYFRTGYQAGDANLKAKYENSGTINYGNGKLGKGLGAYVNGTYRLMGVADAPYRQAATREALSSMANAEALNKGLKGQAKQQFVQEYLANPPKEAVQRAADEGTRATFQNDTLLNDIASSIKQKLEKGHPAAKALADFVMPFVRTPSAIATRMIERTPIGLAKEIGTQIVNVRKGKPFDQRAMSQAIGNGSFGAVAIGAGMALANADLMTFGYPQDEKERKLWDMEGKQPYSVRVGDRWYSLNYLQPFGTLLAIGGQAKQDMDNGLSTGEASTKALATAAQSIQEQSFLKGINGVLSAVSDPEREARKYMEQTFSSLTPNFIRAGARAADEVQRKPTNIPESIASGVPGLRGNVPTKNDVFGNPLPAKDTFLNQWVNPLRPSKVRGNDTVAELRRLFDTDNGVMPSEANANVFGKDTKLDKKQLQDLNKYTGSKMQPVYDEVIKSDRYKGLSEEDKVKTLKKINDVVYGAEKISWGVKNNVIEADGKKLTKDQMAYLQGHGVDFFPKDTTKTATAKTTKKKSTRKSSKRKSGSSKAKRGTMPNWTNISPSKGLVNTRVSSVKYAPVKKPVYKGKKVVRKIA